MAILKDLADFAFFHVGAELVSRRIQTRVTEWVREAISVYDDAMSYRRFVGHIQAGGSIQVFPY
jgi:hypothetical protein